MNCPRNLILIWMFRIWKTDCSLVNIFFCNRDHFKYVFLFNMGKIIISLHITSKLKIIFRQALMRNIKKENISIMLLNMCKTFKRNALFILVMLVGREIYTNLHGIIKKFHVG